MIFEQWNVVLVNFPFSDTLQRKWRPVVILSTEHYNRVHGLVMAVMITSAPDGRWTTDHAIVDLASAGLKRPCFVRWKIATLTLSRVDRRLGSLAKADQNPLRRQIVTILPLEISPP